MKVKYFTYAAALYIGLDILITLLTYFIFYTFSFLTSPVEIARLIHVPLFGLACAWLCGRYHRENNQTNTFSYKTATIFFTHRYLLFTVLMLIFCFFYWALGIHSYVFRLIRDIGIQLCYTLGSKNFYFYSMEYDYGVDFNLYYRIVAAFIDPLYVLSYVVGTIGFWIRNSQLSVRRKS